MNVLQFWVAHRAEFLGLLLQHLGLVAVSTTAAVAIGIPLAIFATRRPRLGAPLIWLVNVAQTIPSLAMFGFLLPLPFIGGLGARVAITVLIVYALLPIVRTTVAGIRSVDGALVEAGTALGMTPRQLLRQVQLPLALPSIVAGIRVAAVIGVGTATIAAAVGAGGLGEYIFRGLSMVDPTVILAGAIPSAALALTLDGALLLAERAVQARISGGRRGRRLIPVVAPLLRVAAAIWIAVAWRGSPATIRIGSKNFTEQILLGELLAQTLESRGIPVERRLNLGGTFICDRAIRGGDIDAYVEYTGTALTAIFREAPDTDSRRVLDAVRRRYADAGVTVLDPLGFENTFAILVRRADAEQHQLRTIEDAAPYAVRLAGWLRLRIPAACRWLSRACQVVRTDVPEAAARDGFVAHLPRPCRSPGRFDRRRRDERAHRRLRAHHARRQPPLFSALRRRRPRPQRDPARASGRARGDCVVERADFSRRDAGDEPRRRLGPPRPC